MAQWNLARYHRVAWGDAAKFLPPPGVQVFAERGAAWVEMPDRVVWADADGTHDERLPAEPTVGEALDAQFHRAVVRGDPCRPGLVRRRDGRAARPATDRGGAAAHGSGAGG